MEAFHLNCQPPAELLSSRRTTVVNQSVTYGKQNRAASQRQCHKSLPTALSTTVALTTTPVTPVTTTTTTATTTVRTLATPSSLTSLSSTKITTTIFTSLGNNTHIPIRLRPPPPRPLQLQQITHIRRNLWSCLYWRHNLTCIMMTMLFVASIVLSGNLALAVQRESFKPKDTNSLNNNANAIYNEISSSNSDSSSSGDSTNNVNSNGNVNAVSHNNANGISNGNSNVNTNTGTQKTSTTSLATSIAISTSNSAGNGSTYATTTSTHTTTSFSSSSSFSGSSYHKTLSSSRNSIELQETIQNGPYFDKAASKNVTALLGKTAYLNCRVKNLGNKTMMLQVSWVRHRDIHLLTVGRYTYTSDQRFRAIHQPQTEDWILQIKYPQHRDSGIYECQVSTTPHMSHYIHLNVVEPSTEIIGAPDLYIESGSTINLTCVILNSPEPPAYIFWNHNNAIINYDSPRGGVSVVTNKGETTTSFLLIKSARPSDSGHYQCNPSNAKPKSVTVHVLNGEFPAAMQRAGLAHHRMSQNHYILVYLLMYLFTLASVRHYIRLPAVLHGRKSVVM